MGEREPEFEGEMEPQINWDDSIDDCWNCGGEGYVFDCVDGFCEDADIGCDLCTRRCDVCNRRQALQTIPSPASGDER